MKRFLFSAVILVLSPLAALAQAGAVDPDNLGELAGFVINAIRGGDWQLAVLAGLVLLVSLVRKLAGKVPALSTFLASDPGGVVVTIATVVPVALLGAKMAGQPLSWALAWHAVAGAVGGFAILRKLIRPIVLLVPKVGPLLAWVIDIITGSPTPAKAEVVSLPTPAA